MIYLSEINSIVTRMRFTAPSMPQLVNKNRPNDEEVIDPHLLSTMEVQDGSSNIQNMLRELQNAIDQHGQTEDQFGVMMSMNPENGSVMITVVRAAKNTKERPEANLTNIKRAIKEYQQQHEKTIETFQTGVNQLKLNRAAYNQYIKMSRENAITNLVSRTMEKVITATEETISSDRKQSLSSETEDQRELEERNQMPELGRKQTDILSEGVCSENQGCACSSTSLVGDQ